MEETEIAIRWAKFPNATVLVTVGLNTVAFGCDDTIVFINITTGEETFYRTLGGKKGEGVACLAGHRSYPLFAFSEHTTKPGIFVVSFPSFVTLLEVRGETYGRILSMKFSESEHLIALTGYPHYRLKIWNFRMHELLADEATGMVSLGQYIMVNNTTPLIIAQYAFELGKLVFWEVHISMDRAFLIKRAANIPFLEADFRITFIFGIDGLIYFVDRNGNLYNYNISTCALKELYQANCENIYEPRLAYYKAGFLVSGTDAYMRYIKKVDGVFTELWNIYLPYPTDYMVSMNNWESAFCLDQNGALSVLEEVNDTRNLKIMGEQDRNIRNFGIIKPEARYVALATKTDYLRIVEITSGEFISELKMDNIQSMRCHPKYPVIAIGNYKSILTLIACNEPASPKFLTEFHLGGVGIIAIQFSPTTHYLVAVDKHNDFFIIRGAIGTQMNIINHMVVPNFYNNFAMIEEKAILRILVLVAESSSGEVLGATHMFFINMTKSDFSIVTEKVALPHTYISLRQLYLKGDRFLAVPFMNRSFHILEVDKKAIKVITTIRTLHQIKNFCILHYNNPIITYGLDGLLTVYDAQKLELKYAFVAGNRFAGGIIKARIDPNARFVFVLGKLGILRCIEIDPKSEMPPIKDKSDRYATIFNTETIGYIPSEENDYKPWLELIAQQTFEKENEQYAAVKAKITNVLEDLRGKIKQLVDNNEAAEEEDTLEIHHFNLHREWVVNLKELARKERDQDEKNTRAFIEDQKRITNWIVQTTWNEMEVQACKVRGIFSSIFCENFALTRLTKEQVQKWDFVKMWRNIENFTKAEDKFTPWIPTWDQPMFNEQRPTYGDDEIGGLGKRGSRGSKGSTGSVVTKKSHAATDAYKYCLTGTSTHEFVEPHQQRYKQIEVVTYHQMFLEDCLSLYDTLSLKKYFNKEFQKLYLLKEDQIQYVRQRNERLRYIQKELEALARLKKAALEQRDDIEDPELIPDELPHTIIKVEEYEVKVKPYISPSRQRILDEIAWKEEQRRLELLKDDFRERALIIMMDGVLEKRWEDEIKIEPEIPEVILKGKDIYDYTKDDQRIVQEYQKKVEYLRGERQRYWDMLVKERTATQKAQDDTILNFNFKCTRTLMIQFRVQHAVKQEEIKILRNALFNNERMHLKKQEEKILLEASERKFTNEVFAHMLEELDKRLADCRYKYEQLQTRDKLLDKQFKSQFSEFAPNFMLDQAYKIFKKRSKWPPRAWATPAILTDVANKLVSKGSGQEGLPLPDECNDYLNNVENLDNYNLAPNIFDQNQWVILCKMRRHKMESEFRIRACGAQLAEAEATLNTFIRDLQMKRSSLGALERELQDLKQRCKEHIQNRYVQIVLPMGLVECALSGRLSDFHGGIVLNIRDVESINAIIKNAGAQKIQAMYRLAVFRRRIIFKEWEHKMFQMTLQDMRDFLSVIENCKVSVEMQEWIRNKKAGRTEDLSVKALNREIEIRIARLDKSLDEIEKKCRDVEKKLNFQKNEITTLDYKIQNVNIDVTEQNLKRDILLEDKEMKERKERMAMIVERGRMIRQVQSGHAHLMELATLLELQKLRTYPTLATQETGNLQRRHL